MPLTLLQKSSVLDAWQGSEYASEIPLAFKSQMFKVQEFIRIEKIILVLSSSEKRTSLFFWYFDKVLLLMLN